MIAILLAGLTRFGTDVSLAAPVVNSIPGPAAGVGEPVAPLLSSESGEVSGPTIKPEGSAELAVDDSTISGDGQILSSGLVGQALVQLIKLDYFSDRCLPETSGTVNSADYFDRADRCFDDNKLPADCRYYQNSILQIIRLIRTSGNYQVFLPASASLIRVCLSPKWPRHADFIGRRQKYPTPIDYYLYWYKSATPAASKAIEAGRAISHPYLSGTEQYLDNICRRVSGEVSGTVRLLDLVTCGAPGLVRPRSDFWLKKIDELLTQERIDG